MKYKHYQKTYPSSEITTQYSSTHLDNDLQFLNAPHFAGTRHIGKVGDKTPLSY